MKIEIVSTFSPSYYDRIAKFFVESCATHLSPSVKLKLYVDDVNIIHKEKFEVINLEETVSDLKKFKERNKHRPQNDWRHAAITFSHKVYATWHAAMNTDADILIWLDADTELHNRIDEQYLCKFLPSSIDVGYLGRKRSAETGFVIFNMNDNTKLFLNTYKEYYDTDKIFDLKEWHDGYVFDYVRKEQEKIGKLTSSNISPPEVRKSHFNFLHKGYMTHYKGDDKDQRETKFKKK